MAGSNADNNILEALGTPPRPVKPAGVAPPGEVRTRVWFERTSVNSRLKKEAPLLAIITTMIALSYALPWLRSHHLFYSPPCIFYTVTRVPCPICGMTRSFIHTARGEFLSAFRMHLLGPPLFMMMAVAVAYLTVSLVSGYRLRYSLSPLTGRVIFWSALGVLLTAWILKLTFLRKYW